MINYKILRADSLDKLENQIGHASNEGWDLAGHIEHYTDFVEEEGTYPSKWKKGKTFIMFFILVMKM